MITLALFFAYTLAAVGTIGWLWIVGIALKEREIIWGVGCLFFPPLSVAYGTLNFYEARIPLFIVTIGYGLNFGFKLVGLALATYL